MKTKIYTLQRGEKVVTLIGCMHIGTKDYYQKVQTIANQSEIVLFEDVRVENQKHFFWVEKENV